MHSNHTIIDELLRINNLLNTISKKPKDFGTGDLLYSSEIHTITTIKDNPNINLTDLSLHLGVTKSATSKFISKLLKKEYITKTKSINNKKEVLFQLTQKGELAAIGHKKYSQNIFEDIYKNLNNLSDENLEVISQFLNHTYSVLYKTQTTNKEIK